jgi:hypothetical protein
MILSISFLSQSQLCWKAPACSIIAEKTPYLALRLLTSLEAGVRRWE